MYWYWEKVESMNSNYLQDLCDVLEHYGTSSCVRNHSLPLTFLGYKWSLSHVKKGVVQKLHCRIGYVKVCLHLQMAKTFQKSLIANSFFNAVGPMFKTRY